ncbi:hypothetical protein [Fibrella aestuarina]|nr:hypothetical protein [Fibrella aestuarina]
MQPFPLQWPLGWPQYSQRPKSWSVAKLGTLAFERDAVLKKLKLLKVNRYVLTSNGRTDKRGKLVDGAGRLSAPGIALYFYYINGWYVVAADQYSTLAGNLRAVREVLNSLHTVSRYHSTTLMQRLLGTLQVDIQRLVDRSEPIKAQPIQTPPAASKQPEQPAWVKTLGLDGTKKLTFAAVRSAYSKLSMDANSQKRRDALVKAYEQAARHFGHAM